MTSKHDVLHVAFALKDVQAHPDERAITGTATYYDTPAATSAGMTVIKAGALNLPEDLRTVKLLIDHDTTLCVGYALEAIDSPEALTMTFYLPPGDLADEALAKVADGTRDGLSVGAYATPGGWTMDGDTLHLTSADLREVSLCAIPAFNDARAHPKTTTETDTNTDTAQEDTMPTDTTDTTTETTEASAEASVEATAAPVIKAEAPAPQAPAITTSHSGPKTVTAAARAAMDALAGGGSAVDVRAALSDILPAMDKGQAFYRPQWLGELWAARRVSRPFIDSITTRPLPATGTKVYGFQWDQRPTVDDYAGNKEEIPTSTASTKPLEAEIKRMAAGWDIDRLFIDRGEPGLLEAMWTGAVEDYQIKTEAKAVAAALGKATALTSASLTSALVDLGTKTAAQGSAIDFILCAPDVWTALASLTKDDLPWWLAAQGSMDIGTATGNAGGLRLAVDTSLTAGTVLAGDKRAVTWFEDNPPLRVNALDLPRGGVDMALFGYYAIMVNDPKSLYKVTVTAPAGE